MRGSEREQNQPSETSTTDQMDKHLPANYNPADYPPVKMRNRKDSTDLSETQRKRRSKNRLSNRRSTGVNYSAETIEEALAMGPNGDYRQSNKKMRSCNAAKNLTKSNERISNNYFDGTFISCVFTQQQGVELSKKTENEEKLAYFKHDTGHMNFAFVDYDGTDSANTNPNKKMPSSGTIAEEAALLGTMPSDSMDDIELKNIQLQFPCSRSLSRGDSTLQEEIVETDRGTVVVAVQGSRNKPAILTYHDLGLNYISSFQAFFNYIDMRALLENFCVYHMNAPGQEEGAPTLPEDFIYPTMDELANQLNYVLTHFGLKQFIGFGVGAGANILARFALSQPDRVSALCLINCVSTQAGWIEWGYQKLNARHLRSKGMTQGVLDYLMWHHFGRNTEERNHDLVQVYKSYFERNVNPTNLALFIDSYVRRTDLNIHREVDPSKKKETTLRMPVMNITGSLSPHADDTVTFNGRLDPANSSWMKISDCGMVLEEQPAKVSEAFRLFLQGEGYVAPLSPTKMALYRKMSLDELLKSKMYAEKQWPTNIIHITENPISAVVC